MIRPAKVDGTGAVRNPPLTDPDIEAIRSRAEFVADTQTRSDLFRLLAAIEAMTRNKA